MVSAIAGVNAHASRRTNRVCAFGALSFS